MSDRFKLAPGGGGSGGWDDDERGGINIRFGGAGAR